MVKMFHFLENVQNLNTFYKIEQLTHVDGNQQTIYFRLIQKLDGNSRSQDYQRYIPSPYANITITFDSLDKNLQILNRAAAMAFPNDDRSIWSVTVLSTDIIAGAGITVFLTDPTVNSGIPEAILLDGRFINRSSTTSRYFG